MSLRQQTSNCLAVRFPDIFNVTSENDADYAGQIMALLCKSIFYGSEKIGANCQLKLPRVEVLFFLIQSPSRQRIVFLAFVLWRRTLWRSSAFSFSVRKVSSQHRIVLRNMGRHLCIFAADDGRIGKALMHPSKTHFVT